MAVEHVGALGHPGAFGVEQDDVGVGADGQGAFARVEAEDPGRVGGDLADELARVHAALVDGTVEEGRQQRLDAGQAVRGLEDVVLAGLFALDREAAVVGADQIDRLAEDIRPDCVDLFWADGGGAATKAL